MNAFTTLSSKQTNRETVQLLIQTDMDYHTKALVNKLEAAIRKHEVFAEFNAEYKANLSKTGFTYLNPERIIGDLLSDDMSRNSKAVEALKAILVVDRSYSPELKSSLQEQIRQALVPLPTDNA